MLVTTPNESKASPSPPKQPFYLGLSFQVLIGVAIAILLGFVSPSTAVAMKPLGDAFIRLITMIITLVIFCTLVTGIAGMDDMKKVGRVGGKALLYFEIVSSLALLIGLVVGNLVHPGSGFNVDPSTLDARAVADYAGQAKSQSVAEFLAHIIPNSVVDAFARGDILQVLLVSLLFGFALSIAGPRCKPLVELLDTFTQGVFGVVAILMRFAPIGAFGAMAFTIGKYGLASLGPLAKLMAISRDEQTKPKCCTRSGILWDLIAVYPAQTSWSDRLPPAVVFDGPVVRMMPLKLDASDEGSGK